MVFLVRIINQEDPSSCSVIFSPSAQSRYRCHVKSNAHLFCASSTTTKIYSLPSPLNLKTNIKILKPKQKENFCITISRNSVATTTGRFALQSTRDPRLFDRTFDLPPPREASRSFTDAEHRAATPPAPDPGRWVTVL